MLSTIIAGSNQKEEGMAMEFATTKVKSGTKGKGKTKAKAKPPKYSSPNVLFAQRDEAFRAACHQVAEESGYKNEDGDPDTDRVATKRQASKWRNERGQAWAARRYR